MLGYKIKRLWQPIRQRLYCLVFSLHCTAPSDTGSKTIPAVGFAVQSVG